MDHEMHSKMSKNLFKRKNKMMMKEGEMGSIGPEHADMLEKMRSMGNLMSTISKKKK